MRLHARTEAVAAAYVCFDKTEEAVSAVQIAMQNSIPMARIELLDGVQMDTINHYSKTNYSAKSTLFVGFHGSETGVRGQATLFVEIREDAEGNSQLTTMLAGHVGDGNFHKLPLPAV